MQVVILAGGRGSRLSEETHIRPKPMVEIDGQPILWHVMKIYALHGLDDFVVCLGYKGYLIKEYFANYFLHRSDVTFDLAANTVAVHRNDVEPWRVTLVDTGAETMTGGRLRRVLPYLGEEPFCLTYGDGVADIDVTALLEHHRREGALATVTAVKPPARFGSLQLDGGRVEQFAEKRQSDSGWINGGFFVLNPDVQRYLRDDTTVWESEPMEELARAGELSVFRHEGFWHPMDTLRDKEHLEDLCAAGAAPWLK